MRIALLSDIHSNLPAFTAVMHSLRDERIDEVFFLGDYSFGGPDSNECVDIVMNFCEFPRIVISGNKEEYIDAVEASSPDLHPVISNMYNELGPIRLGYLRSLPRRITRQIGNLTAMICHNPSNKKVFTVFDRLNREKNAPNLQTLEQLSEMIEEDICVFGHYHLFMHERVNNKHFICAGSIGLPLNGDPRAQYMILEITNDEVVTETKHVAYDVSEVARSFERRGFFEKFYNWSIDTFLTISTGHNYIGTQDLRK